MDIAEIVFTVTEWIGVIAFAVSGAIVAVQAEMDIFGVSVVGCVTAVGGGIIRDIIMGSLPPSAFSSVWTPGAALLTSVVIFIILYCNAAKVDSISKKLGSINDFFDAAGLAVFSAVGVERACAAGFENRVFFVVFLGTVTGIGGGILRDVLADQMPMVFKKRIYALASVFGSALYYAIALYWNKTAAIIITVPATVLIRLLAAKFRWKLPKVKR